MKEAIKENLKKTKRIFFEALPEIWSYKIWTYFIIAILIAVIKRIAIKLIVTRDDALTTANLKYVLFSPQGLFIIILGIVAILIYIAIEIFGEIILTGDLYADKHETSMFKLLKSVLKRAIKSIRLFLNPTGFIILLYIFIIAPILGVGYMVSFMQRFYIPEFIMDVVFTRMHFLIPFLSFMLIMLVIGGVHIFTLHGVLLCGDKPRTAMKKSRMIVKRHWKELFVKLASIMFVLFIIKFFAKNLFYTWPAGRLETISKTLPINYKIDINNVIEGTYTPTELESKIILVRVLSALVIFEGEYIYVIVELLCGAYLMLSLTRYFAKYSDDLYDVERGLYEVRKKRIRYLPKVIVSVIAAIIIAICSIYFGLYLDAFSDDDYGSQVIAHRTGGVLANENSIEGLELAIKRECFGAETDVQRTKDGHYIINHDDTFKRLAGVNKASKDMTLAEIKELKLVDTLGRGTVTQVPTIEEFLDVIKGRIKLFIELKGVTADRQMVDDIVRIVKEKDCVNDVVLISLKSDVIYYAEEKYSEMETGVLIYGGFGDIQNFNADWILMEEELAELVFRGNNEKSKKYGIWTVNNEVDMRKSFDYGMEGIITDDLDLYDSMKEKMDKRTDFQIIENWNNTLID